MLAEPVAVHAQQGHVECQGGPLDTPVFLTTQLGPPGSSNAPAAAKTRPPGSGSAWPQIYRGQQGRQSETAGLAEQDLKNAELISGVLGHHFLGPWWIHDNFDVNRSHAFHGLNDLATVADKLWAGRAHGTGHRHFDVNVHLAGIFLASL